MYEMYEMYTGIIFMISVRLQVAARDSYAGGV